MVAVNRTPIDRSPTRLGSGLALGAGLVVVAAAGPYSAASGLAAAIGVVLLAVAARTGDRRLVSVGAAALLGGVLVAGVSGASPASLFVGVGATVLAWDAGGTAIDLGAQLGRAADTRRVELVHAAASAGVAVASAAIGYAVFLVMAGGQPLGALLLLLLAGAILVAALDAG